MTTQSLSLCGNGDFAWISIARLRTTCSHRGQCKGPLLVIYYAVITAQSVVMMKGKYWGHEDWMTIRRQGSW